MGFVVPILYTKNGKRDYVTLDEIKESDAIHVSDSGDISRIKVKSSSEKPIFIRVGSIMKGNGTQSRGVEASIVVMPQTEVEDLPKVDVKPMYDKSPMREIEVPARCVHASHAIRGGSNMSYFSGAPREVDTSFLSRSGQHDAWNSVHASSSRLYACSTELGMPSDNLVNNLETVSKFKGDIQEAIKNLPLLDNQVGVVIFDRSNVVGLELFDHTDSWAAFQNMVIDKYSDILVRKNDDLFELKADRIPKKVEQFVTQMLERHDEIVFDDAGTKTYGFTAKDMVGEYTTINDKVIHILAVRKEGTKKMAMDELQRRSEAQPRRGIFDSHDDDHQPRGFDTSGTPVYGIRATVTDSNKRPVTHQPRSATAERFIGTLYSYDEPVAVSAVARETGVNYYTARGMVDELYEKGLVEMIGNGRVKKTAKFSMK